LSFETDNLPLVEGQLVARGIEFVEQKVEEGGTVVYQVFFHDPDLNMIEICTCSDLPTVRLSDGCVMKSKPVSMLQPSYKDCLMDSCCSSDNVSSTPSSLKAYPYGQQALETATSSSVEESMHYFDQNPVVVATNHHVNPTFNSGGIRKDALKLRRDHGGYIRRSMSLTQLQVSGSYHLP
jgi:hypothetical protein